MAYVSEDFLIQGSRHDVFQDGCCLDKFGDNNKVRVDVIVMRSVCKDKNNISHQESTGPSMATFVYVASFLVLSLIKQM